MPDSACTMKSVAATVRERAAGAERRDRQHDEVRVARAHAVDVEAPGTEALDDDVGVGEQRVDVRVTGRADHRTLARAEVAEERRRPLRRRRCRSTDALYARSGSPPGGSTLITSTPASASSFVQYAPGMPVLKSIARRCESGSRPSTSGSAMRGRYEM